MVEIPTAKPVVVTAKIPAGLAKKLDKAIKKINKQTELNTNKNAIVKELIYQFNHDKKLQDTIIQELESVNKAKIEEAIIDRYN